MVTRDVWEMDELRKENAA